MLKYDLVLYDLDGTLQDSIPLILDSFRHSYEEVTGSCSRTAEDFKTFIGKPLEQAFGMHDPETAGKLYEAYIEYNHMMMRKGVIPLFPGIKAMLESVEKTGALQGVVTSKRRDAALMTIEPLGIDRFFDVMVFLEDSKRAKPYGDPLIEAASRLGISDMKKVLYVGDAVADVMSAKDCGAASAVVGWSYMPRADLENAGPDFFIKAPEELSCIIGVSEL